FADAEKVDACLFGKLREADDLADPLPFRLPFSCMRVRQMIAECIDAELEAVVRIDAVLFHVLHPFALLFPILFSITARTTLWKSSIRLKRGRKTGLF